MTVTPEENVRVQEEVNARHQRMSQNSVKVLAAQGMQPNGMVLQILDALAFAVAVELTGALTEKVDKPKIHLASTIPPVPAGLVRP